MKITENYMDPDVAYLLGMLVARGELIESPTERKIIVTFPFKSLQAEGIRTVVNQKTELMNGINQIRDRMQVLLETPLELIEITNGMDLVARFLRNSMIWRNIRYILSDANGFENFIIPPQIMDGDVGLVSEFLRGFSDVAGYIRQSNNYYGKKRRVYLEVNNRNWQVPVQICYLLQVRLDIPVHLIQWGHPNVRSPHSRGSGSQWAKEHQIKVFSEAFEEVSFYVDYKRKILSEFAEDDRYRYSGRVSFCNPSPSIRRIREKPIHNDEGSDRLPEELRGSHFDAYWQICKKLGCTQLCRSNDKQMELFVDLEED